MFTALFRIMPYLTAATGPENDDRPTARKTLLATYYPSTSYSDAWRNSDWPLVVTYAIMVAVNFIIPLKSSLFTIHDSGHMWSVEISVAIWTVLLTLHSMLCGYTFWLRHVLQGKTTGLRWDPIAIADLLVLFRHSNFLPAFAGLDVSDIGQLEARLTGFEVRLGYWILDESRDLYWHGFGIVPKRICEWRSSCACRLSQSQD